ncbi:MAG: metal-dependent transcriptional regulator, partial [Spirochaetes bacterium]
MKKSSELTPSMEDYLETVLLLEQKNRVARVKD